MLRIKILLIFIFMAILTACSTTAKGPITNREYKVQVGGWQDMDEYNKARDIAVEQKEPAKEDVQDCVPIDCRE